VLPQSQYCHCGWQDTFPAPAKLNLFLHVTGRRSDGYHELQTVFRFIDYADYLSFSPRHDGDVCLLQPLPGVTHEANLVVRAARLLKEETSCREGVSIQVEKNLPIGGGVGGGSSNAATTLLALNHLWQLSISRQRLQTMALKLGADVPVFIFGRNTFAQGVGEDFTIVDVPPAWYVVLKPPVAILTETLFKDKDLVRNTPPIRAENWRPGFGVNDLQSVALRRYPVVAEHIEWLSAFGEARMSGSGASIFASFATKEEAERVVRHMPTGMRGCVAEGLGTHPLLDLVL